MAGYSVTEDWSPELVRRLFLETREHSVGVERFEWSYLENPAGRARVWVLLGPKGDAVGFTAGLPRTVWVDGAEKRGLNCGDFSITPAHRSLGPALVLRRPAKALVDSGEYDFLYAHPVPAMLAVHQRVGHASIGRVWRWVRSLRAGAPLRRRVGGFAASVLAPPVDLVWTVGAALRRARGRAKNMTVSVSSTPSADVGALAERVSQSAPVLGRRTAESLEWRFFRRGPGTVMLECRGPQGRLRAYAVVDFTWPVASILDLLGDDPRALVHTVNAVVGMAGVLQYDSVSGTFSGLSGISHALTRAGFRPRESTQEVAAYAARPEIMGVIGDINNWWMSRWDQDV
jgi:hypothetical protein